MIFVSTFELHKTPNCIRFTYDEHCIGKDRIDPLDCYETSEYFKQLTVRRVIRDSNTNT